MCLVAFALLYASPHIALYRLGKAIDRKDADAVSEYVDFPALRENFKAQLLSRLDARVDSSNGDAGKSPSRGFAQMLAIGMVNQLTEALVSPAGVMMMLESGKPGKAIAKPNASTEGAAPPATNQRKDLSVDYQGWSKVFVHPKDQAAGFVFKRDGLMGWKLVAVRFE